MRISDWSSYVCSSDLDGSGGSVQLSASVDVAVDLADAAARGIHMSRLYLRLQEAFATETVTPGGLRRVLQEFIDSQNGLSTEIGRASCRESVCQYVSISVAAVSLKKQNHTKPL